MKVRRFCATSKKFYEGSFKMGLKLTKIEILEEDAPTPAARPPVRFYGSTHCPHCQPTLDALLSADIPVAATWCDKIPSQCPESIRVVPTVVLPDQTVIEGRQAPERYRALYAEHA